MPCTHSIYPSMLIYCGYIPKMVGLSYTCKTELVIKCTVEKLLCLFLVLLSPRIASLSLSWTVCVTLLSSRVLFCRISFCFGKFHCLLAVGDMLEQKRFWYLYSVILVDNIIPPPPPPQPILAHIEIALYSILISIEPNDLPTSHYSKVKGLIKVTP